MDKQDRDQFFNANYEEICEMCKKATSRICWNYGNSLRADVYAYVMEGIVRGLTHMTIVSNWRGYLYIYGYKNGIVGVHELIGKKRNRTESTLVGIDLIYAEPMRLEKLYKRQQVPGTSLAAWMNKMDSQLDRHCFFEQLRPGIERDVLGLLMTHHSRQSIVRRTHISQRAYTRVAHNLHAMYDNLSHNRPIDHVYDPKRSTVSRISVS